MLLTNTAADAAPAPTNWRAFTVTRIETESAVIKSFYLEPADGGPIVPPRAGQHLTIRLTPPDGSPVLLRTYTVSAAPSAPQLRISVRKLGTGSCHLHDSIAVGDMIDCSTPAGDFIVDCAPDHAAVMIAAGVGITPMLAMIGHLVDEGERTGSMRPVTLFYAAHSKAERGFDGELRQLHHRARGQLRLIRLLVDPGDAEIGADYEEPGRLSASVLEKYLGFRRHDFYLCGPPGFMQAVYDDLIGHGVVDSHIFAESFGPASLQRQTMNRQAAPAAEPSRDPVTVGFAASGGEAIWAPGAGSLLEFAEASGLTPEFGCRQGACGACKTALLAGAVTYFRDTSAAHSKSEVLICCAMPAASADGVPNQVVLAL